MKELFFESLYDFYKQSFTKDREIFKKQSDFQKIEIFENDFFGKILVLDDVIQLTEKDEFFYSEMFSHVPLYSLNNQKDIEVLIVGGGDGAILREVLKHKNVKKVVMIEIDEDVTTASKKYMPLVNNGAFEDKRADVRIIDGIEFVKNTNDKFDVIIVDSTDPVEIATPLFTEEFYLNCKNILKQGGILSTQSGVPFYQKEEGLAIKKKLTKIFKYFSFYLVPVPTYTGSFMILSFASQDVNPLELEQKNLQNNFNNDAILNLKYYNSNIHLASFILPEYIKQILLA